MAQAWANCWLSGPVQPPWGSMAALSCNEHKIRLRSAKCAQVIPLLIVSRAKFRLFACTIATNGVSTAIFSNLFRPNGLKCHII